MNGKEEGRLCLFTSPTPRSCHAMPMKNPPHPGRSIRTACLEALGLSVTEGAEVFGSHPANPQQRHPWQVGDQPPDGDSALQGIWQHARNVVTDAACL